MAFREGAKPQVIFAPTPRQSIDSVGIGRDKIYAVITDNVIGAVHVFTPGNGWLAGQVVLATGPGQGSADIVSANDYGPQAMYSFQNYLTPTTLYFDEGNDQPKPIKSLAGWRFDASGLVTEQFQGHLQRRYQNSVFRRPGRKTSKVPAPTILYGYGGFEVSR